MNSRKPNLWKGALAGIAGGLAGTIVMTQFQHLWSAATRAEEEDGCPSYDQQQPSSEDGEDATMKVAGKIAGLRDQELTQEEKKKAGTLVHYGFGTAMGAIFGAILESRPRDIRRHPALSGLGFGSLLFVGADEIAVPALKLSGTPRETPFGDHVYGLASHLVYGAVAGTTAGLARRLL